MALYAQTNGTLSTNSGSFVPIPGLSIAIPEGVDTIAMVVLNVPNPYATGSDFPGGPSASPSTASFRWCRRPSPTTSRIP
jgi:mannose-binding lectin